MEITIKDFMLKQPNYPDVAESDKYYIILANRLAKILDNSRALVNESEKTRKDVVLAVTGYFQDVVADAGIWRSFSTMCKELYGKPLPIYPVGEDYIESELNIEDVQFVVWYVLEMSHEENGSVSPFSKDVMNTAKLLYTVLDAVYEDAPVPVEYQMMMDVDLNDKDDAQKIYDLSYWLFWDSYFLRPAAKEALRNAMERAHEIIRKNPDEDVARPLLSELNQSVMIESVTGPLSLSIGEWIELIVDGKMPKDAVLTDKSEHKYYTALMKATGGKPIAFIDSYDALESFLSNDMGWGESAEGHFPEMREFDNFVILGNRSKGVLIAHDVAQYIKHPDNPMYDSDKAVAEGHKMVLNQGVVPVDLLKYLFENGLVPDLRLPFVFPKEYKEHGEKLLHDNWDFFARLYLQSFYRAD